MATHPRFFLRRILGHASAHLSEAERPQCGIKRGSCLATHKGDTVGILDGLLGNASKIDTTAIQQEFAQVLAPGEVVEHAYKLIRDYFVFTNKRLVLVDKQGLTGSKVEYHSIPYRSITHFSVETAGSFDLDAELKIWISGTATPVQKTFNKKLSIYEVQSVLASYVLG